MSLSYSGAKGISHFAGNSTNFTPCRSSHAVLLHNRVRTTGPLQKLPVTMQPSKGSESIQL